MQTWPHFVVDVKLNEHFDFRLLVVNPDEVEGELTAAKPADKKEMNISELFAYII